MNKLLASTALVGAMFVAAPAFAGGADVVLNGQLNFRSPTTAVGVDVGGKKVDVDVKNLDVTAVGNLNETIANGGGSTFTLTKDSSSTKSSTKDFSAGGRRFDVSYESSVSRGRNSASHSLSVSGSAWNVSGGSTYDRTRSSSFSIEKTRSNRVFVGSLQANVGSATTAIGVDAGGKKVNVDVKNLTVTAVGNMNSTRLK